MGIQVTNERIRFNGAANTTKFDTNREGFLITDYRTGTFTIPGKTVAQLASGASTSTTTSTLATGITSGADVVIGQLQVSSNFGNAWLALGGTTVVDLGAAAVDATYTSNPFFAEASVPVDNDTVTCFAIATTFYVSGTTLRMDLDEFHPAMQSSGTSAPAWDHSSYSCRYFAFIGTFDLSGAGLGSNKVMKADGTGKVAVWDGDSDEAPFTNPTGNLSRTLFHSDLENVGIVAEQTGSITLSATASGYTSKVTNNLFAHGQGSRPIIGGHATISGTKVPLHGSFVVEGTNGQKWICTVSANATHVIMTHWKMDFGLGADGNFPNVNYRVWIGNYGVDGSNQIVRPSAYNGVQMTATRLRAGYFDTDSADYLYKSASEDYVIPTSRTIGFGVGQQSYLGGQVAAVLGWRYSCNGYVKEYSVPAIPARGYPGTPSFNASRVKVAKS